MGDRYQREDARLDGELSRMERELSVSLERRVKLSEQWLWLFAVVMPLLAVVLVPVAAIVLDAPTRGLVLLPLLPLAFGVLLVVIGSLISVPAIRTREESQPGDTLLVEGEPTRVVARIHFGPWPFPGVLLLCQAGDGRREGVLIGGDEDPCHRVALEVGGVGMRADEIAAAQAAGAITPQSWHSKHVRGAENIDSALRGVTSLWYYAPSATQPAGMAGARLWFGDRPDQRHDPRPTFTATGVKRVESSAVWLLQ